MEQTENRVNFLNNLFEFCELVELNPKFWEELKTHSSSSLIDAVEKFNKDRVKKSPEKKSKSGKDPFDLAQKVFIFLEFTKERILCNEMVNILVNSGNIKAAEWLKKFNISPKFEIPGISINSNNSIDRLKFKVKKPTLKPKSNTTIVMKMDAKPRGRCIIINNIQDPFKIQDSDVFNEIFTELYFEVDHQEGCQNLTTKGIKEKLEKVSEDTELKKHDAIVVMIISHGQDERIVGVDGEELSIQEIVNIFSDEKCEKLKDKPKIFFFNCCRIKTKSPKSVSQKSGTNYGELTSVDSDWKAKNNRTIISYACSEGGKVYFSEDCMSYFGQALAKAIERYACEESLQLILNRVRSQTTLLHEESTPEVRILNMEKEVYFNPGYAKDEKGPIYELGNNMDIHCNSNTQIFKIVEH